MWNDTTFDLTRREIRTKRSFDEVTAAIKRQAPVVVPEANHELLGPATFAAIAAGRMDRAELRRQVEGKLGSSGRPLSLSSVMPSPRQASRTRRSALARSPRP